MFGSNAGGVGVSRPERRPKLHALQAVPGAGVIGQSHEVNQMWSAHSSTKVDSGPAARVKADVPVQQLVVRQEEQKQRQEQEQEQEQEATRLTNPQQPRSTSAARLVNDHSPAVVVPSSKAEKVRGALGLGGVQYPRSATSTGMAETRRSTVRHIDDILHHPSRIPRQQDTRGLIPDERSQASLVSSVQRLAPARLRRESVYVTGLVQPALPASVSYRDQHPWGMATTTNHLSPVAAEKVGHRSSSPARRGPEQRERIGPFEDGTCRLSIFL